MLAPPPPALCVVGNKCDLAGEREVSREQGLDFAHQIGAMFTETSAAHNSGEDSPLTHSLTHCIVLRCEGGFPESGARCDNAASA